MDAVLQRVYVTGYHHYLVFVYEVRECVVGPTSAIYAMLSHVDAVSNETKKVLVLTVT